MNIENYLAGNSVSEIRIGKSGADVYEINGSMILKHVERRKLDPALFDTYTREALFYQSKADNSRGYLPEIVELEISEDEIILLMRKYSSPDRSDIDEPLVRKVARALACIHTDSVPAFLDSARKSAEQLSEKQTDEYRSGWESVLGEHADCFDPAPLAAVAGRINEVIAWHDSEERVLVHGDFHWDNLLEDSLGNVLVCDWQGVRLGGPSDDLSFFLSRLGADGVSLDPGLFLHAYAGAVREITGRSADTKRIAAHMAAANVITSFIFWHQFLHGADTDRVRGVYEKMTGDFRTWLDQR